MDTILPSHDGCLPENASHFSSLKKKEFHKKVSQDLGALREPRGEKSLFIARLTMWLSDELNWLLTAAVHVRIKPDFEDPKVNFPNATD